MSKICGINRTQIEKRKGFNRLTDSIDDAPRRSMFNRRLKIEEIVVDNLFEDWQLHRIKVKWKISIKKE